MDDAAAALPPGYATELNGVSARVPLVSSGALGLVFVLALAVHLPGAGGAVRELRRPFVIPLAVPLSMVGALAAMRMGAARSTCIRRSA